MNTHGTADTAYELQATCYDLLPAGIVGGGTVTVPVPPSLTLAAFPLRGYVYDGTTLVYVDQEAHTVTLTGGDGNYWLGLGQNTWTTVASWNRTAGTHYLWRANATEPPSVDGLLVWCQVTVAGGAITGVSGLPHVLSPPMSKQNSNAVAITGGTATFSGKVGILTPPAYDLDVNGIANGIFLNGPVGFGIPPQSGVQLKTGTAPSYFGGTVHMVSNVGIAQAPQSNVGLYLRYSSQANWYGLVLQPLADSNITHLLFTNAAGAGAGSITGTTNSVSYNTSSDGRLKERIETLSGGLATLKKLLPVRFRWKADGAAGVGFVAQDVAAVAPEAVTGTPEAPEPMGMDLSKLVPYLTAALQETLAQVEALTARVQALEAR